jgi:hypothetical protein
MQQETKCMFVYSTDWYGRKSFRMLPLTAECPFNEVIYDPNTRVLAVISKDKKDKPQMLPKLTDKGQVIPLRNSEGAQYVEERRIMETYYEYYIDNKSDIERFIQMFAVNSDHDALNIVNEPIDLSKTETDK